MISGKRPLDGVRIVEMDAIGPVPFAAMMLADFGADVVRMARPDAKPGSGFLLHRGRPSLALDLKDEADRRTASEIIACADVLLEGFRPGVMERLGLGPEPCLAANRKLVYARLTGWGQDGPLATVAGHDLDYIALTGALRAIGPGEAPPPVPLNLLGDYGGGALFAVGGILAALLHARASGEGQVVDAAITDGVAMLSTVVHSLMAAGRWRGERGTNTLDGGAPFYRCYRCADGEYVAVGALEPQFFALLLAGLGISAERFVQRDQSCWAEMEAVFAEAFAGRPRSHWLEMFATTDACVQPVLSFEEAPLHPHNRARGTYFERDGDWVPAPAPRLGTTPAVAGPPAWETKPADVLARWSTTLPISP
ncbi:MAG: L-carnitine dehydratase/bile acid-inducible protein [Alphaproteobacteria bacterium]|nr:L-carnitine dehydratase/bile acid-inducible protein [Alphaproteobacteria bacterium]